MIISLVKKRNVRYLKRGQKFGVELPKSVAAAYEIDQKNGNIPSGQMQLQKR